MPEKPARSWLAWIAFVWLAAVVAIYYVSHKPFSPELAVSLGLAAWRLVVALSIVTAAGGIGRRILKNPFISHPLARLSFEAALGFGVLSLAVLLLGAVGELRLVILGPVLLVLLLIFARDAWGWWSDWRSILDLWRQGERLGRFIALCLSFLLLFTLVKALAPPLKFDALVYHLPLPHLYLSAGRIVYVPDIMYWGMPQNAEMLYTWAIQLGGDPAATNLAWFFGLLSLAGMAGFVAERLGELASWVSLASLLCGFTLADALSWGYVDWLAILFGVCFLIALDAWQTGGSPSGLRWAGVMAGLALGTKYTAGVLLISGLLVILWSRRFSLRIGFLPAFQFGIIACLVSAPWWIKNALATGNPFYPGFFPAGAMDSYRLSLYQSGGHSGSWLDLAFLPVRLTFLGAEMAPGYSSSVGPLLLGLGAVAWLGWKSQSTEFRRIVKLVLMVLLPVWLIWAIGSQLAGYLLQARLYFALFPALAVLSAAGFVCLSQQILHGVRLGRLAGFLVGVVLFLNVVEVGLLTFRQAPGRVLLGLSTPDQYLEDNLGWYMPAMRAIQTLPENARVVMLWETRSLHCLPRCEPDEILDRWLWERYGAGSSGSQASASRGAGEILQGWKAAGFSHVLYYRLGADFIRQEVYARRSQRYTAADWAALQELLSGLTSVADFGQAYTLYQLAP